MEFERFQLAITVQNRDTANKIQELQEAVQRLTEECNILRNISIRQQTQITELNRKASWWEKNQWQDRHWGQEKWWEISQWISSRRSLT